VVPEVADVVSAQVRGHVAGGEMVSGVQWRPAGSRCDTDAWRTGPGSPVSGFVGQLQAARAGGWPAAMACRALRRVQGAAGEGAGGLFLAGDSVSIDSVQDGGAVPGAGCCFLGCDAGGEPQGQCGVAQVAGSAGGRARGGGPLGGGCARPWQGTGTGTGT
jgi:hypothetical protein